MTCNGCGNDRAYRVRTGVGYEICDRCGSVGSATLPDVYWDGTPEHGLADDPKTGQPRTFASKMEKARYLMERGLREAGDTFHGAPASVLTMEPPKEGANDTALKALKHVRNMGLEEKRKAYKKILKENGLI